MPTIRIMAAAATASLAALALLLSGCTEPLTMYQVPESAGYRAEGGTILVMPFMDTRTFVPASDPHTPDLGNHARTIFVAAMREHGIDPGTEILTPAIPQPTRSLTNAEVAEIGRRHGADTVVAGQVFSFTDTRAASIPPRAGMFVRVISSRDGALLFTGDHYQAASRPMAGGGRDLQAKNVSSRLVEGFLTAAKPTVNTVAVVASHGALAMLAPVGMGLNLNLPLANNLTDLGADDIPEPLPLPSLAEGDSLFDTGGWDEQIIPEVPPLLDFEEDFYKRDEPANPPAVVAATPTTTGAFDDMPTPLPPPPLEELGDLSDVAPESIAAQTAQPEAPARHEESYIAPDDLAEDTPADLDFAAMNDAIDAAPALEVAADSEVAAAIDELPELELTQVDPNMIPADAVYPPPMEAAKLSGNDLAADLFENDGDVWLAAPAITEPLPVAAESFPVANDPLPAVRPAEFSVPAMPAPIVVPEARDGAVIPSSETAAKVVSRVTLTPHATDELRPFDFEAERERMVAPVVTAALAGNDNGPVVSMPLAVEQPRPVKSVDMELAADPAAAMQDDRALVATPARSGGPIRVLILPYHDRDNPNNLIPYTGGGEVVTTLYGTQLALDPQIQIMWDSSGQTTHQKLTSRDDAIEMGRLAGADYVIRGQVVEFRRAQSVPSWYSAVISTAVLAAQVFFAEMSGVDVATEVYRVQDGLCVMSRRDRAQQKYVVQAEKTVRRMAAGMADSVSRAVRERDPEAMDPLIDELSPVTVLSNPR